MGVKLRKPIEQLVGRTPVVRFEKSRNTGAATLDPAVFRFIGEKLGTANPSRLAEARAQVERLLAPLDDHLRERQTLLGDGFTAADIMVGYCLGNLDRHLPLDDYPGLAAYLARLKERPAAQPYFEAIAENVPRA